MLPSSKDYGPIILLAVFQNGIDYGLHDWLPEKQMFLSQGMKQLNTSNACTAETACAERVPSDALYLYNSVQERLHNFTGTSAFHGLDRASSIHQKNTLCKHCLRFQT